MFTKTLGTNTRYVKNVMILMVDLEFPHPGQTMTNPYVCMDQKNWMRSFVHKNAEDMQTVLPIYILQSYIDPCIQTNMRNHKYINSTYINQNGHTKMCRPWHPAQDMTEASEELQPALDKDTGGVG